MLASICFLFLECSSYIIIKTAVLGSIDFNILVTSSKTSVIQNEPEQNIKHNLLNIHPTKNIQNVYLVGKRKLFSTTLQT